MAPPFATKWIDGTAPEPPVQSRAYDPTTIVLRQSLRTHFEAPFIKLLVGEGRALLIDTGTGDADLRSAVDAILARMEVDVDLLVAHTHAHDDHVGGDSQFAGRARTSIVGHTPSDVARELGLSAEQGTIDLGGRLVDVISTPGHERSHVAFYDRQTRLFLTGDTLYPGRLYVRDWEAYRSSIARMVAFIDDGRPVSHVVGAHIEITADDVEYGHEVTEHPNEHRLELGDAVLRDLAVTVAEMGSVPARRKRPSYVVVPVR